MQETDALLIIDVQNDFCPGGALAVPEGDQVVPILNEYIAKFNQGNLPIFVARDWHPEKTRHFKSQGGVWPRHCVQGTKGAAFHPQLAVPSDAVIISHGINPNEDGYSGFEGYDERGVNFVDILRQRGIKRLFVGGLATDYCVKFTALDALREGFQVVLIEKAVRGVNLKPGDSELALEEMVEKGAEKV